MLSNERILQFVGDVPRETQTQVQANTSLEFNHKQSGSVIHHVFSDVLLLLETSHYAIDAMAHLFVLCKSILSTTQQSSQIQPIIRKLAFMITYMRKMEAEQFWLLHKEVCCIIILIYSWKLFLQHIKLIV